MITKEETIRQSTNTFNKWRDIWDANTKENKCNYTKPTKNIIGFGTKRRLILFAFGPSFADNLAKVKAQKLHYDHDIMVVDKALGPVLEAGIIPNYVITADAHMRLEDSINLETFNPKLCKKITLISCVLSNPSWATFWKENGGDTYFYINKDGIRTHHRYGKTFNFDPEKGEIDAFLLPAATNVANSGFVFSTLLLGYKEIFLCGFNYSWDMFGSYYGTEKRDSTHRHLNVDKRISDNHITMLGIGNKLVQTSSSMMFSARWLTGFILKVEKELGVRTINLTGRGLIRIPFQAILKEAA